MSPKIKLKKKGNRASYPLPQAFVEYTIWHNIIQMASVGKAYIPCLLAIVIK